MKLVLVVGFHAENHRYLTFWFVLIFFFFVCLFCFGSVTLLAPWETNQPHGTRGSVWSGWSDLRIPIVILDCLWLPARFSNPVCGTMSRNSIYLCCMHVVFNHSQQVGLGVEIGIGIGLTHGDEGDKESRELDKTSKRPVWMSRILETQT